MRRSEPQVVKALTQAPTFVSRDPVWRSEAQVLTALTGFRFFVLPVALPNNAHTI